MEWGCEAEAQTSVLRFCNLIRKAHNKACE
jgi:hypothetical protein